MGILDSSDAVESNELILLWQGADKPLEDDVLELEDLEHMDKDCSAFSNALRMSLTLTHRRLTSETSPWLTPISATLGALEEAPLSGVSSKSA